MCQKYGLVQVFPIICDHLMSAECFYFWFLFCSPQDLKWNTPYTGLSSKMIFYSRCHTENKDSFYSSDQPSFGMTTAKAQRPILMAHDSD